MNKPLLTCLTLSLLHAVSAVPLAAQQVAYQRDIKPLLAKHCVTCHGPRCRRPGFASTRPQQSNSVGPADGRPAVRSSSLLSVYASSSDFDSGSYTEPATLDTERVANTYSGGISPRSSNRPCQSARAPIGYFAFVHLAQPLSMRNKNSRFGDSASRSHSLVHFIPAITLRL